MKKSTLILASLILMPFVLGADNGGCDENTKSSDVVQREQQEKLLVEATAQVGMPAITNFREKKQMKDIFELRDKEGLVTYTYTFSEQTGRLKFFGETIGYGLPYATQFTNPEKVSQSGTNMGYAILPQADPNGLFMPASAEGTWVMMKNPTGNEVLPIYVEPRIIVSPFKLPPTVADYADTSTTAVEATK